jgi:hypothetical protein
MSKAHLVFLIQEREICAARARATGVVKNIEQTVGEAIEKVS